MAAGRRGGRETGREEEKERARESPRFSASDRRRRRRRRRNELWRHTVAATRGGDLWWDYRWRYFFITVSPGCLSLSLSLFLFSSFSHPEDTILLRRSSLFWTGWLAPVASRRERSSFGFFPALPISPYVANVHAPARAVQLAGGCILITFMSSDIPARFIAPAPADSAKTWNRPSPLHPCFSSLPPFFSHAPFLTLPLFSVSFVFLFLKITPRFLGPRNQLRVVAVSTLLVANILLRRQRNFDSKGLRFCGEKYNCMCLFELSNINIYSQ